MEIIVHPYYPEGVRLIIATGSIHYVGQLDDETVLKYPHFQEESEGLSVEAAIYERIGQHDRVIGFKGRHDAGLRLEYAPNGTLQEYLKKGTRLPLERKIQFAKEIAEGVAHVHRRGVLICDIHVRNILLDSNLHIKLCDFQGKLLGPSGEIVLSGGALESAESFMPRDDFSYADIKTDLFALGSTIHYILEGHRPFAEIKDDDEIADHYRQGHFPQLDVGEKLVHSCWSGNYSCASEVADDLNVLLRTSAEKHGVPY